jgi:tricorn protease
VRLTCTLFCVLAAAAFTAAQELPVIRDAHYPDLSPDGSQIAFSFQGDIWVAGSEDGIARRLTVSDAYEARPRFSPDGRQIAFISNRHGNDDIFLVPATGGQLRRLTYHSADDVIADWSPDGKKILFSARHRDHDQTCPYEIEVQSGYVRPILRDVCSVSATDYSPDGKRICGIRRGQAWWRKGYRGSSNAEIMVYDIEADQMETLTDFPGMDNWPVFSADGSAIHFVSERQGRPNVFSVNLETGETEAVTRFEKDAVTFLSASGDGKWLVFEWNFGVYRVRSGGGTPRKITLRAPIDYRETFESDETLTGDVQEMEVNRDGSLVAIRVREDIFLVKPEFKNDSIRITDWPGPDGDYFWSPSGEELAYVSQINGTSDIWVADAETYETRCLVRDDDFYLDMIGYTWDGGKLLFRHNTGGDGVFAADPETGEVSRFLPDPDIEDLAISPDGRWVLAQMSDRRSGTDLYIKPLDGGEWVNVTKHPDGNWGCHWSPDGERIYFISGRDDNREIYSLDLRRQPAEFDDYEQQIADKEKEEEDKKPPKPPPPKEPEKAEAPQEDEQKPDEEKKPPEEAEEKPEEEGWKPPEPIEPFEIDFERIEDRVRRLTKTDESEGNIMILPDGKTIVYTRENEIWAMEPDGENQRRYVNGSFKFGSVRLQGDGKAIFFVDDSKLKTVPARGGNPSEVSWKAKIHRDTRLVQREAFRQAWALLDESFYAQDLHGVSWRAEYERYSENCDGTLVKDDLHHLIGRMIGELNASHLGIYGGPSPSGPSTAHLGIAADPEHRGPGVRVAEVMPDGPADEPESTIAVGEYIMTLDGEEVANNEHFHELLSGRAGERVKLTVNAEPKAEGAREISIKPVSSLSGLQYERWVRDNRKMVERLSKGRVYYAHIRSMDTGSRERFERDLFGEAQRHEALIIDVRNNGGGYTHDQLLELLTKKVHGWTARRGKPLRTSPYTQFDGPKALLINQNSASDAEIFPNAFREKGLGPIVGMTTAGAVIGTNDVTLVNGSRFRVPVAGWYTKDGADLENMGVKPDIEVPFPYEAYRDGRDPQIKKAVEVLLDALEKQGRAAPPDVRG